MNSVRTIILVLCLGIITGCQQRTSDKAQEKPAAAPKIELSGNITITGAYALYPLVKKWSDDFMNIHPGVKISINANGTGQGIGDLISGKTLLSMISRPLTDEELGESIWTIPVARAGVAPIVNQRNPYLEKILHHGMDPHKLIQLFTGNQPMTWGELLDTTSKERVTVYTRADESGAADVWANFLWKESTDLKGIKVTGDDEMIRSIQRDSLAVGYCNFSYAFDAVTGGRVSDIQVIPIDLDFDKKIDRKEVPFSNIKKAHRGIWLGYYPKNLTRDLTLGSIGKPKDMVILEFLNYTLTAGQASVGKSGFCELNSIYIRSALEKLR
jgi:phosphate transport system substrate-binding protein